MDFGGSTCLVVVSGKEAQDVNCAKGTSSNQ